MSIALAAVTGLATASSASAETCVGASKDDPLVGYFLCTNATVTGETPVTVTAPLTVCAGVCVTEGDTLVSQPVPAGVHYDYLCTRYWGLGASAFETVTMGATDC